MDITFVNGVLLFAILAVLVIYLYQSTPSLWKSNNRTRSNNNNLKGEGFIPVIWDTCKIGNRTGMPVHRVGPVYNFHQHFNKYSPLITCSQNPSSIPEVDTKCTMSYPTGIPEMGWRNWYLANFSKNEIKAEDPFAGTSIRNFLNNMENVDNLYRKCL
jgi:hypothetical protein